VVREQELELDTLRTLCAAQRIELRSLGRRDAACRQAMENCASTAAHMDELAETCQRALYWANQNHAHMVGFMHLCRRTLERTIILLERKR